LGSSLHKPTITDRREREEKGDMNRDFDLWFRVVVLREEKKREN